MERISDQGWRSGDLMVSALISWDRTVQVRVLAWDIVLGSRARHF